MTTVQGAFVALPNSWPKTVLNVTLSGRKNKIVKNDTQAR